MIHFGDEVSEYRQKLTQIITEDEIDTKGIDYNKKRDVMRHKYLNKMIGKYYDGKYEVRSGHKRFLKKHF